TYVQERCRSTAMNPTQYVRVKGETYILAALKREYPVVERIASQVPSVAPTKDAMNQWIIYLDKKYPDQFVLFGTPISLEAGDARKLGKDVAEWIDSLIHAYRESGMRILKEDSIDDLFPADLMTVLDETARQDLADG